jgi:predicted AAA+ superfamily ATPase
MEYQERILDMTISELMHELPAVALVGAKGVGKTETAKRLAATVLELDISTPAKAIASSKDDLRALKGRPVLIDEWSRVPVSWDNVRRIVDEDPSPARFILTGSATSFGLNIHSGAGRIVQIPMRPLSLEERALAHPAVSLARLLDGGSYDGIYEKSGINMEGYAHEVFASGFPGIRNHSDRGIRALLDGYIESILNKEFDELNIRVRKPGVLRAWLAAYAAATATTASYAKILRASTPGEEKQPSKDTTLVYRDILDRLYLTDRVEPWLPTSNFLAPLGRTPKHFLVDPALALRLLKKTASDIMLGNEQLDVGSSRDNSAFGRLFESLVASSLKVYAQRSEAEVSHFRTPDGRHEVDFIIERGNTIIGIEVKLATQVTKEDASHLNWLEGRLDGGKRFQKLILNVGSHVYNRDDGVLVVPFALLGS